jgi:hypothetical protein
VKITAEFTQGILFYLCGAIKNALPGQATARGKKQLIVISWRDSPEDSAAFVRVLNWSLPAGVCRHIPSVMT